MQGTGEHARATGISRKPEDEASARAFAIDVARSLRDDKCEDIIVLDLRGKSQVTDYTVIASGTSERQMRSAGKHAEEVGVEAGFASMHDNLSESGATWIVIDFVDVVVHIFEPATRAMYDLEMLWGDAERIPWRQGGEDGGVAPEEPETGS